MPLASGTFSNQFKGPLEGQNQGFRMEGVSFLRKQPRAHQRRPEPHLEPPCRPQTALSEARRSPCGAVLSLLGVSLGARGRLRTPCATRRARHHEKYQKNQDILTHFDTQNRPRLGPDAATTISRKVTHPPCENVDFDTDGGPETTRHATRRHVKKSQVFCRPCVAAPGTCRCIGM